MAKYILKRKTYGMVDAVKDTAGGIMGGTGKALDSKPAAIAGGALGGSLLGGTIGGALTGTALGALGGPLGWLVGAGIGAAATRGFGKGLKNASDSVSN